jgi:hypothetical protein
MNGGMVYYYGQDQGEAIADSPNIVDDGLDNAGWSDGPGPVPMSSPLLRFSNERREPFVEVVNRRVERKLSGVDGCFFLFVNYIN